MGQQTHHPKVFHNLKHPYQKSVQQMTRLQSTWPRQNEEFFQSYHGTLSVIEKTKTNYSMKSL